jgi:hypothetical protein
VVLVALEELGVVVGKLRFSDEIGVSGVGNGVLGGGISSMAWARKSPPGAGPGGLENGMANG